MSRPAIVFLSLDEARGLLKTAKTADELRAAQSVVLPLDLGLSLAQTAVAVGRATSSVSRLRAQFIEGPANGKTPKQRGGSRREIISPELAEKLAEQALRLANSNGWDANFIDEFQRLIERHHGRPIGRSTVYRIYSTAIRSRIQTLSLGMLNKIL
jgi:hypothetical protein